MNVHDNTGTDRPDGGPSVDDEVTTDVDPAWIAAIRSDLAEPTAADVNAVDDAGDAGDVDDERWRDAEPAWDPEATVGVSDGLIERIRSEMAATPPVPGPERAPAPPPLPPERSIAEPSAPPPPIDPRPIDPPPIDPPAIAEPAGVTDVDRAASTTVRWEPRQRLTTAAPVNEGIVIAPTPTSSLDRTKVAIAIVAAVAIVVIVWLLVGSGDGDAPPPVDSVPSSVDGSTPTASVVVDPALEGAGG